MAAPTQGQWLWLTRLKYHDEGKIALFQVSQASFCVFVRTSAKQPHWPTADPVEMVLYAPCIFERHRLCIMIFAVLTHIFVIP